MPAYLHVTDNIYPMGWKQELCAVCLQMSLKFSWYCLNATVRNFCLKEGLQEGYK